MKQELSIKIGGESGQGVKTTGYILTKAVKDLGLWTFSYTEYPSLIKGGHSTLQINISTKEVKSAKHTSDILVAFNKETIDLHFKKINQGGYIVCDKELEIDKKVKAHLKENNITLLEVPVSVILEKAEAPTIMGNSVKMGAVWSLISTNFSVLEKRIKKIFKSKDKNTQLNVKSARGGYDFAPANKEYLLEEDLEKGKKRIIGKGNEIAGLALYASGCRIFNAYPMTPSTGILHYLAARAEKYGMIVKQAEDEMTAVLMTIGANFAGTRSATATSGGGLALMAESISLSGMTEIPLVVFNSQRPGPATGVPTWTEQGDLSFVLNIGHGDFPRVVLAPGDLEEVFDLTLKAFNLAEQYQLPVIILLDKYISASWYQVEKKTILNQNIEINRGQILDENELANQLKFERYKPSVTGVSPRSLPGQKKGEHLANSDEHTPEGYSSEDPFVRKEQMDKRMRKLKSLVSSVSEPKVYGPKKVKTTIVCWGSTKGIVQDALKEINKDKPKINMLHYKYLYPFRSEKLKELSETNNMIILENNYSAQLAKLIKQETGLTIKNKITKYSGTTFFRDELTKILKQKI